MSVFISYSHKDSDFVDQLANALIERNIYFWMDRWELNVGDSLTDKIQTALTEASFLCVVLSKYSVDSDWCKREINAGLIRELEEKRVVILPILTEDCQIPLFLRDKLYADFRNDFTTGLNALISALSKEINSNLGRVGTPQYLTDWGLDWGLLTPDDSFVLYIDSISFAKDQAWSILANATIVANDKATKRYKEYVDIGLDWVMKINVLTIFAENFSKGQELKLLIKDNNRVTQEITVVDSKLGYEFKLIVSIRRLGEDTGKDILFNYGSILEIIASSSISRSRKLTNEETLKLFSIL
ncbi:MULTISPECIES: toll/interleukin-1 receptor domain-containing protein [Dehalobacter]|jgi:hypothetical protein|uniref:TIR domain-containing protein n=1 Tax=Dehalobacter restrictus TaxID=55583 RepID=A0A857DH47_9FIRM|nr:MULTISPECIES: toll/interleukin-1 receptor domain-containing protein [Dehalobacter]MCG1024967.1 toll/interleukin-1 receptor domain-containing protein [Dehalobacter sp.]QGZ99555.1 TIR domain-containing protein [Dehalobacter restrictus]